MRINIDDFEEYISVYVCILCTVILRGRLRMCLVRSRRMWSSARLLRRKNISCLNTIIQALGAQDIEENTPHNIPYANHYTI